MELTDGFSYMIGVFLVAIEVVGLGVAIRNVLFHRFEQALVEAGRIPPRVTPADSWSRFVARYQQSPAGRQQGQPQPTDQLERLRLQSTYGDRVVIGSTFLAPVIAYAVVALLDPLLALVVPFPGIRVAFAITAISTGVWVVYSIRTVGLGGQSRG